jgi:hypothetical protein
MYPYHNRIKQRIRNGELVDVYYTEAYSPRFGPALVLVFNTLPFRRPIRPKKWSEYEPILAEWEKERRGPLYMAKAALDTATEDSNFSVRRAKGWGRYIGPGWR